MAEKKVDRRALKTQKLLKESLAELLTEKELRKITVQELCDKADIHRVTFYKHYYDIYELNEQLQEETLARLALMILEFHEKPSIDFGETLIAYIQKNPAIFKMIFSSYNTNDLRYQFTSMIEGAFRLVQTEKLGVTLDDKKLNYFSAFWSSGCVAVIERWVLNDFSESKDFIIKTMLDLDINMERFITEEFIEK